MTLHEFPRLGERYWEQRLENGLLLRVVPKPGFARSYAFLGVESNPIPVKALLQRAGFGHGLRLPLLTLSSAHTDTADRLAALAQALEAQSSRDSLAA